MFVGNWARLCIGVFGCVCVCVYACLCVFVIDVYMQCFTEFYGHFAILTFLIHCESQHGRPLFTNDMLVRYSVTNWGHKMIEYIEEL